MVRATDSAMKSRARRVWVAFGLAACVSNVGCARMRSYTPGTPLMLGAAAPFGKTKPPTQGGDLYAQEVGRGVSHSRALLAQDRARLKARNRADGIPDGPDGPALHGGTAPLQVALQPPETIRPKEKRSSNEALASLPASEPTKPSTSVAEPKAEPKSPELSEIVSASRARLESMTSYQVPLKRQERVGGALLPAEEVLLSIRRNPRAVRLEWPDGPSKGREVLYSAGDNDGLMHVKMPDTIVPVPPISMAIDSPMVLRSSRHPITEAGYETIIKGLEENVGEAGAADSAVGKITYEGLENPGQLDQPGHKIVRVTPNGETWLVYVDPTTKLPVMVEGTAANGDLLERYLFGAPTVDPEALAAVEAFDPGKRWGPSSGLLSRLARAGGAKAAAETQAQ
jgi:hypothetical protein